ncbi:MAG: alpha/beta hydrolase [Usitatibacter sp.]
MRLLLLLALPLLLGLLLAACSPLRAVNVLVPERGFERAEGIAYGDDPRQRLDVYVPRVAGAGALPVIVFFYGGAWQGGQRGQYLFMAQALASRGFVVVVPDYRVYPQARYPAFVEDGARAVEWTVANIGAHRGDPKRLVLMGHSAGAHIAAMLAYNRRFLDSGSRAAIQGFVGLAGPYDFKPTEAVVEEILGAEGGTELAMPSHWVRGGEPPSLLVTGDRDTRVEVGNTERLARRLRDAGSPVEVRHYPSLNHSTLLLRFAAPFRDDELLETIAQFARRVSPS